MAYYIRAKSYFRYASDLFKDLSKFKNNPSELQKKAQEIFKLGLKAIWALSYIKPPEKPPEFEEIWNKTLESLEPEDISKVKKIKESIFSQEIKEDQILKDIKTFLEIIEKVLKPIL